MRGIFEGVMNLICHPLFGWEQKWLPRVLQLGEWSTHSWW